MLTYRRDFKEATRNITGLEKKTSNQRLKELNLVSLRELRNCVLYVICTSVRNESMLGGGSSISKQRIISNYYLNKVKARQTHSEKQAAKESNYQLGTSEVTFTCNA